MLAAFYKDINIILLLICIIAMYILTFNFNPHLKTNNLLKNKIKSLELEIEGLHSYTLKPTRVLEWIENLDGDVTYVSPTFELAILLPKDLTHHDLIGRSMDIAFFDRPKIANQLFELSDTTKKSLSRMASIYDVPLLDGINYNIYKEVIGPDSKSDHFILTRAYISSWNSSQK